MHAKHIDYQAVLKNSGLRVTPARLEIIAILEKIGHAVDVASIIAQTQTHPHPPDQATVYRTIESLVKEGIIQQVDFREGKYRYELAGHHHHHLVCTNCSSVIPLYEECLAVSHAYIAQKYHFEVADHTLEFFGLCQKCR